MAKLRNLLDQIPELEKRVYALELLSEVDVTSLDENKFNSWIGLLFDSIDLLSQTSTDIRILGNSLSDPAT